MNENRDKSVEEQRLKEFLKQRDKVLLPYNHLLHDITRTFLSVGEIAELLSEQNSKVTNTMILNWQQEIDERTNEDFDIDEEERKAERNEPEASRKWRRFSISDCIAFYAMKISKSKGMSVKESSRIACAILDWMSDPEFLAEYFHGKVSIIIYDYENVDILYLPDHEHMIIDKIYKSQSLTLIQLDVIIRHVLKKVSSCPILRKLKIDDKNRTAHYFVNGQWLLLEVLPRYESTD